MKCPKCGSKTKVIDTGEEFGKQMRQRKCKKCGHKFTTEEIIVKGDWLWYRQSKGVIK